MDIYVKIGLCEEIYFTTGRDFLKKKKWQLSFMIGVLIVGASILTFYLNEQKVLYGNDKESIVKVMKSYEGYGKASIEILDIKDFEVSGRRRDKRVVAFLSDNSPGYLLLGETSEGDYYQEHFEVRKNETFSTFTPHTQNRPIFLVVTNDKNHAAKMEISVNGQVIEQTFTPQKPSITWIDFPQLDKRYYDSYRLSNRKFYDKNGNKISINNVIE